MEPPESLRERFAEWRWEMVWSHAPRLQTWRIGEPGTTAIFLKLVDHLWREASIADEVARLQWLEGRAHVPRVLESGLGIGCDWMLTSALPGRNAIDPGLVAEPEALALALGAGLRRFHEIPTDDCPFDVTNDRVLAWARSRLSPEEVAELVVLKPQNEDLVVTHGDACLPNFLLEDGRVTGYVDVGAMGVADRWRDIAVCLWSLGRNLGRGWDEAFLSAYGVEPDERKLAFYQGLYFKL